MPIKEKRQLVGGKDNWVLRALEARHIVAWEDGSIHRLSKSGLTYKPVKFTLHKKSGRLFFTLTFEGFSKSVLVNRVIALAFLPNPDNLPEVNHKDGVKSHNAKSNLEWSSSEDNRKHAFDTGLTTVRGSANPNSKLNAAQVAHIRARAKLLKALGVPVATKIAAELEISESAVRAVIEERSWKHV